MAEEKKIDIEIPTPEDKTTEIDVLTLEGMKQALTGHFEEQKYRSDLFWKKLIEKKSFDKLPSKEAIDLLKALFTKNILELPAPLIEQPILAEKKVPAEKAETPALSIGSFQYEIDAVKTKSMYEQLLSDLPDPSTKVFYILADIDIDETLKWEDLGVTKAESFSGVIKDSWKKMAQEHFKGFDNIVIINKELSNLEGMNPHSVTLKWKSRLKRTYIDEDKKTAKFELSAQYVLLRTLNNESLLAFDFPPQKREFSIVSQKSLSSGLASLIYNLLNSQSGKIGDSAEAVRTSQVVQLTEFTVTSASALSDIYGAISWLNENMKSINFTVELKTYSNPGSVLIFKGQADNAKLINLLSANGGKMAINEQKLLIFNSADKSFAIIPKDGIIK